MLTPNAPDVVFGTTTFTTGLVLNPGQTGAIKVTVTPQASQIGQVVRGVIYVDTFNGTVNTGDEVVPLPYAYTVVKVDGELERVRPFWPTRALLCGCGDAR